jgi:hypothetical protein
MQVSYYFGTLSTINKTELVTEAEWSRTAPGAKIYLQFFNSTLSINSLSHFDRLQPFLPLSLYRITTFSSYVIN